MIATLITAFTLASATPATVPDTGRVNPAIPLREVDRFDAALVERADTPQTPLIEYSDAYATRLAIHRYASYAMLPLFAAQYYTGSQLYKQGASAPSWIRHSHGPIATGVAVLFTLNTVTGIWNLLESRKDPEGRTKRTLHSVLMLAADAGFVATGALQKPAENSASIRSLHRTIGVSSMGVAGLSWLIMMIPSGGN